MSATVVQKPPRDRARRAVAGEVGALGVIALSLVIFHEPTARLLGPVLGQAVAIGFAALWLVYAGKLALSGRFG